MEQKPHRYAKVVSTLAEASKNACSDRWYWKKAARRSSLPDLTQPLGIVRSRVFQGVCGVGATVGGDVVEQVTPLG